jgi:hypothetical protein
VRVSCPLPCRCCSLWPLSAQCTVHSAPDWANGHEAFQKKRPQARRGNGGTRMDEGPLDEAQPSVRALSCPPRQRAARCAR